MSRRKFGDSTVTSVRCERNLIRLADSMDILLSDALMKGILLAAEFRLETEPEKYNGDTHTLFVQLQQRTLDEFSEWLGIQQLKQKKMIQLAEQKIQAQKPKKKIRVYDRSLEEVREIPEDQFDPEWHSIRQVQQ